MKTLEMIISSTIAAAAPMVQDLLRESPEESGNDE